MKPQFGDLIGKLIPERKAKPSSSQALETLAIVALKQPCTIGDINNIRSIESAGTVQTLRNRKLIARTAHLGPRREKYWRTTQLFLETFNLTSPDELREAGRLEEVFPTVCSVELEEDAEGGGAGPEEVVQSADLEGEAEDRDEEEVQDASVGDA
jgi:segregation and condensation protein B